MSLVGKIKVQQYHAAVERLSGYSQQDEENARLEELRLRDEMWRTWNDAKALTQRFLEEEAPEAAQQAFELARRAHDVAFEAECAHKEACIRQRAISDAMCAVSDRVLDELKPVPMPPSRDERPV
jgi:hypothetical protein